MIRLVPAPDETIAGVGQALRDGRRTCVAIVEWFLKQIDQWEPQVHAWVVVDCAGALELARQLDRELAEGKDRGPLHGIPIGIKDIIDVQGVPTACGARGWADRVAGSDAVIVQRLRSAGAVILGKTVTTPYAWIDPPVTRNPWGLDRTPGGSSSGSAAAVACGMCLGAIGTQTGGSITRPASFCGVAGLKPTFGALSTAGVMPFAPSLDTPGPIARTVGDLALLFEGMKGTNAAESVPSGSRAPGLGTAPIGFFAERVGPEMGQALADALGTWAAADARLIEVRLPPDFDSVTREHRVLMAAEAAGVHGARFAAEPGEYPPWIAALIQEGLEVPVEDSTRARGFQARLRKSIAALFTDPVLGCDVLIVPATLGPAPDPSTTGDPVFNSPWTFTGLPTISFPLALSRDGMPLAAQLVGRRGDEAHLFRCASWCEAVIHRAAGPRST